MADQIAIRIPKTLWQEGSAFDASVNFRLRSTAAASIPTSIKYRLDCLTTKREVLDWTTVSASAAVTISITGAQNAIQNDCNDYEVKQLTVMADDGLATQHRVTKRYRVENLYGSP
jgi:hypothetical protein